LADGVYAAVASEKGYAICNAGIIDIGDRTIIFDTFISPEAARDLLKATGKLTSNRITHIVNSHAHNDHIRGNQVFDPNVDIISTVSTRDSIARNEPEEIKEEKDAIPKAIIETRSRLSVEKDPKRIRELTFYVAYLEAIGKSHSELRIRLPNLTFTHRLRLHGSKRTIELLPFAGHTRSDVVLHLPDEKIAFMGDLLFIKSHPYIAGGFPGRWKRSLAEVEALGVVAVVPGHGPVGRSADLSLISKYIQSLEGIVADMNKAGKHLEQVFNEPVPKPFDAWLSPINTFYYSNLKFLYDLSTKKLRD